MTLSIPIDQLVGLGVVADFERLDLANGLLYRPGHRPSPSWFGVTQTGDTLRVNIDAVERRDEDAVRVTGRLADAELAHPTIVIELRLRSQAGPMLGTIIAIPSLVGAAS